MRVLLVLVLSALALPAAAQHADGDRPPRRLGTPTASTSRLAGVVTDAETGQPVMGAGVVIPALGIGAVSQRDGHYVIEDVPPGRHAVRTGAFRYHLATVEAEVAETGTLDIALQPGAGAGCAAVHEHGDDGAHPTSVDQ